MTETETVHAAGRCIPLLRWHRWTRWEIVEGEARNPFQKLSMPVAVQRQTRNCLRCGRTQVDRLER